MTEEQIKLKANNSHSFSGALIGTVLGDATIYKQPLGDAWVTIEHGSKYIDYLEFKQYYFSDYLPGIIRPTKHKMEDGSIYNAFKWSTPVNRKINYLREDFYPRGYKIAKRKVLNRLTTLGFALWAGDDGSLHVSDGKLDGFRFHINGFDERSHKEIISWLQDSMGLNFNQESDGAIRSDTRSGWRILSIIKPYIELIPSLRHKVDMSRMRTDVITYQCLPNILKDRLEGRNNSLSDQGFVWQIWSKEKMWPLQICKRCSTEFRRQRDSYFCSPECNKKFNLKTKSKL